MKRVILACLAFTTLITTSNNSFAQCMVTGTTDGVTCDGQTGTVSATANASNKIYWYDQMTGGNLLDSGNILSVPNATTTTMFYAEAAGGGGVVEDSINTFNQNNGQVGAFFDCQPKKDITVTGFNFVPRSSTSYTVRIYYKSGTHVGNETNSGLWTLLGTSSSFSVTANNLTEIPITLNQQLSANQRYAFYVIASTTLGYTNGSSLGAIAVQNSDVIIYQGRGSGGAFSSSLFTTRTFAGTMKYEIGSSCTSARTGVMLTVHPKMAVDSQTVIDSSCRDFSTQLYANSSSPVNNYQWQIYDATAGDFVDVTAPFINNGSTLNVTQTTDAMNGAQLRCILTGICGKDTSATMSMTVLPQPAVVKDPADVNAKQGDNVTFEVDAVGLGITYQWQVGINGVFANINDGNIYQGVKTNILKVRNVAHPQNEYQFRCAVNGDKSFCNASPDTSKIGVLYVEPPASVNNLSAAKETIIYPNPANGSQVIIKSQLNNISSYIMLDKLGRIVQKGDLKANVENKLNITQLSSDIYFVHTYNKNGEKLDTTRFTKL